MYYVKGKGKVAPVEARKGGGLTREIQCLGLKSRYCRVMYVHICM